MIISRRSPESGDIYALIAGTVAKDPKYSEDHGGRATFSIKYGSVPSKEDPKKRYGIFFNCIARRALAEIGASLEKGDRVLVAGRVDTRTYQSKKSGQEETWTELDCEIIIPQDIVSMGLAAGLPGAEDSPQENENTDPYSPADEQMQGGEESDFELDM